MECFSVGSMCLAIDLDGEQPIKLPIPNGKSASRFMDHLYKVLQSLYPRLLCFAHCHCGDHVIQTCPKDLGCNEATKPLQC